MKTKRKKKNKRISIKVIVPLTIFVVISFFLGYNLYRKKNVSDTFDKSHKYSVKGIDISHHNPILDWVEVKNQNIQFAYIKATEGITHDDRNYSYNYTLAKESNIKIGSYHFYNFGVSGREQAKHFLSIARFESGDLLPAIDVEHSPANPYSKDTAFVSSVIKELSILENRLYEFFGYHPVIYTNMDCYKLYVKNFFPNNPIWISSLNKDPKNDINNWIIWQFTHKGELPGKVGDIDFNYFRFPVDRLSEFCLP